ncbi:hypothetical protein GcM1_232011 [Golovinomyces cichoracearum]|uniref:Uncharacterized protein n=1 Tax=Golovinomyces cichoracearum TaxID=62708 RepID=A0A420IM69_9PEZI|nr:hypothetical protein GcM1_232011 [Golovinomyces cichoracearum]
MSSLLYPNCCRFIANIWPIFISMRLRMYNCGKDSPVTSHYACRHKTVQQLLINLVIDPYNLQEKLEHIISSEQTFNGSYFTIITEKLAHGSNCHSCHNLLDFMRRLSW